MYCYKKTVWTPYVIMTKQLQKLFYDVHQLENCHEIILIYNQTPSFCYVEQWKLLGNCIDIRLDDARHIVMIDEWLTISMTSFEVWLCSLSSQSAIGYYWEIDRTYYLFGRSSTQTSFLL